MKYNKITEKWETTLMAGETLYWDKTFAISCPLITVIKAEITDDGQGYERAYCLLSDGKKKWIKKNCLRRK